jgi:hypothetical protein
MASPAWIISGSAGMTAQVASSTNIAWSRRFSAPSGKENWPRTWTFNGHRAGEMMATNLELTGRTPGFSRGR